MDEQAPLPGKSWTSACSKAAAVTSATNCVCQENAASPGCKTSRLWGLAVTGQADNVQKLQRQRRCRSRQQCRCRLKLLPFEIFPRRCSFPLPLCCLVAGWLSAHPCAALSPLQSHERKGAAKRLASGALVPSARLIESIRFDCRFDRCSRLAFLCMAMVCNLRQFVFYCLLCQVGILVDICPRVTLLACQLWPRPVSFLLVISQLAGGPGKRATIQFQIDVPSLFRLQLVGKPLVINQYICS